MKNHTSSDSNKLRNVQRKFANLRYSGFAPQNSFCNYESILTNLHRKQLYSRRQILDGLFLINFPKYKFDYCSITDIVLILPTVQIRDFCTFSVSNVSIHRPQQGTSRLQTSTNLQTCSIYTVSQLRIHFVLLNPTKLHHYRVTLLFYCLVSQVSLVRVSVLAQSSVCYVQFQHSPVIEHSLLART